MPKEKCISRSWIYGFRGIQQGEVYSLDDGSKWKILDLRFRLGMAIKQRVSVVKIGEHYFMSLYRDRERYLVTPLQLPNRKALKIPRDPVARATWMLETLKSDLEAQSLKRSSRD